MLLNILLKPASFYGPLRTDNRFWQFSREPELFQKRQIANVIEQAEEANCVLLNRIEKHYTCEEITEFKVVHLKFLYGGIVKRE